MRWRAVLVAAVTGLVVLVGAAPALAKGADQVTISGPGLAQPLVLGGEGEPGTGSDLGRLADGTGLFVAMFGASGGLQLASSEPAGPLGPRYELAYRVPGGGPTPDTLRQDPYPSAAGGPVAYTPPDQSFYGGQASSGWYRAPDGFVPFLVSLGVPAASAPAAPRATAASAGTAAGPARRSHHAPWLPVTAGVFGAGVLALVGLGLLRRRRPART
jgi:hypothetical protein